MKKLIFAVIVALFAACTTDTTQDVAVEVPDTIEVSFEENSRIQLSEGKTVWTQNDLVSVFYRSDANQQWKFQGNTGDRSGILKRIATPDATKTLSKIVAVYPYSENYYINPESCNIEAMLPAEQTYLKDSYGLDGNILVSASEFNQLYLRNVCGWLKIQLTGEGQVVEKITLKGNNGEQVAGLIYINSADATAILASEHSAGGEDGVGGTLVLDDTILAEVTLNCPDGVTLGEEPTAFYIALPPQTFENGISIEALCKDGSRMSKSTTNSITISRNTIQPMEDIAYVENTEIHYTSTNGNIVIPNEDAFGCKIISNTYEDGEGVITLEGKMTEFGSYAFYNCSSLASITIPNSVTSIGSLAFDSCSSLASITIPDSVTSIGDFAFQYCDSLTSVTIPDSVTSIGNSAFCGCSNLSRFYGKYASSDMRCLLINRVLNSFAPAGLTEYTIPRYSVTSIGDYAFYFCGSLTNITIPDSVTSIGENAFYNCSNLTSVYISDITAWCNIEFSYWTANPLCNKAKLYLNYTEVTELTIPDSVTSIGDYAFYGCSSLTSVTIPDSVTSIGYYAFRYCSSLKSVYCKPTTPPTGGSNMFGSNASGRKIYVPRASESAYEAANGWSSYAADIEPYDFTE